MSAEAAGRGFKDMLRDLSDVTTLEETHELRSLFDTLLPADADKIKDAKSLFIILEGQSLIGEENTDPLYYRYRQINHFRGATIISNYRKPGGKDDTPLYHKMKSEVAKTLSDEDVSSLAHYQFTDLRLVSHIKQPNDLFEALEKFEMLGPSNTETLKRILKKCRLNLAASKVE